MTARKRKTTKRLTTCSQCGALVLGEEAHITSFSINGFHEIIPSTFSVPFIFNQRLYSSQVLTLPIEKMRSFSGFFSDFVLLNPDTMRQCGLVIGHQCLVVSYEGKDNRIVTVFADVDIVSPFTVCCPPDYGYSGPLMIAAIDHRTPIASTLTLTPEINNKIDQDIVLHVKNRLAGSYIISGETRAFWYFGQEINFKILDTSNFKNLHNTKRKQFIPDDDNSTIVPSSDRTNDSLCDFISACSELESTILEDFTNSSANLSTNQLNYDNLELFQSRLAQVFPFLEEIVFIDDNSSLFFDFNEKNEEDTFPEINLSSIGGMEESVDKIMSIFKFFYSNSPDYGKTGGILLHGPPGCGKTSLVSAVANHLNLKLFIFAGISAYNDRSKFEKRMDEFFSKAISCGANSAILVEDVDLLVNKKSESDSQRALKFSFLSRLDNILKLKSVFVVCTTCQVDLVELSLRRRLESEIEIPTPNSRDRSHIFDACLSSLPSSCCYTKEEVHAVADIACGYVAGDIMAVCRLAYRNAVISGCDIFRLDLLKALKSVRPSSMKELTLDVPKIRWSDIGGLDKIKEGIRQLVEWPILHAEAFSRLGIKPPRGILMYGPPGCSKTMIAQAIATESHFNFLSVKGSELLSKYVGESEKMVRQLFAKARAVAPTVVFFDEIDALVPSRGSHSVTDRVLAQLLTELDGVESLTQVVFVSATNRPDMIDNALLRPGRVDRLVYVALPDEGSRRRIFDLQLRSKPLARDVLLGDLARFTEGYSGAEIVAVCQEAAMEALSENINAKFTEERHFLSALEKIKPRSDAKMLEIYRNFSKSNMRSEISLEKEDSSSDVVECVEKNSYSVKTFVKTAIVGIAIGSALFFFLKMR